LASDPEVRAIVGQNETHQASTLKNNGHLAKIQGDGKSKGGHMAAAKASWRR
jgi:hypothetical protein